jgi:glycosyltransferase involved in cell wall biosynthesis
MRITVLWSSLSNYSVAFFKELALSHHYHIQIIYFGAIPDAPYDDFDLSFCKTTINRSKHVRADIEGAVNDFSPNCILMSSWNFLDYMEITKRHRKKGVFVVSTLDHQWRGSLKQWLGVISSRWFLKPSIDCFLVAGDRQAYFAHKLGYESILYGLYAACVENFQPVVPLCDRDPSFLFIGRLAPEKGIANLMAAYRLYRKQCVSPWSLKIAGSGKLEYLINNAPGVTPYGFVQPPDLPKLMQSARALILPSKREPWGVVIHEGAAAGLPILATYECGAVTSFVRDGVNGFVFQSHPRAIRDAMVKITRCKADDLERFGRVSQILAQLWTPRRLAQYFAEYIDNKGNCNG